MRRVILGVAMAAVLAGAGPVLAQSNPFRPVLYINDSVVTQFDIEQRAKFLQILRAPDASPAAAEKAVIEDRLRMIAARQMNVKPTEEAISAGLSEFASRGDLTTEQFEALLRQNGVDPSTFRDFVISGLVWRDIVRMRVVPNVHVSEAEIEQEFKKIVTTPKVRDVLVSELIIPVPQGQEAQVQNLAARIAANTASESDFASAARQYSATRSAEQGGRLPWTPIANLPPTLRPILLSLQPGQVSQPLNVPGAVVLFYLRDTRGTVMAGAQDQELDYLRLRLGNRDEATRIAKSVRNCSDLYIMAKDLPADRLIAQKGPISTIPADVGLTLATLDNDESTVLGGDVLMLCKRQPALLAAEATQPAVPVTPPSENGAAEAAAEQQDVAPQRDEVRNIVFNRKISVAADAYLAELRADAVVRRP